MPQLDVPAKPELAVIYKSSFARGYGRSYASATAFATVVAIGLELVKSRNLRLPSLKWGRWAGTAGNSKFLFNKAGSAKFKLDKVPWVSFKQGKADFSAVAHLVKGKASFKVVGLTGDRNNDWRQSVKTLSKLWGKKPSDVEAYLSQNGLRVHHYKKDLIQLVPENYHRCAHQGTVKDLLAIAAMGGATAGLYSLLASFQEGGE